MKKRTIPCPLCGYDAPATPCPHCGGTSSERSLAERTNHLAGDHGLVNWAVGFTEPGGTQQCITNRVDQHIGIGMTQQAFRMLDLDTPQHQSPALDQGMHVEAVTDTKCRHALLRESMSDAAISRSDG